MQQNTMYSSQNNHNAIGLTIQIKRIQFSVERTVATGNNNSQRQVLKIVDLDLQNPGFAYGQLCVGWKEEEKNQHKHHKQGKVSAY
jgi:hypothetical protein